MARSRLGSTRPLLLLGETLMLDGDDQRRCDGLDDFDVGVVVPARLPLREVRVPLDVLAEQERDTRARSQSSTVYLPLGSKSVV